MMKKNYLWAVLASMFFVGCSQNDDLPEGNENQEKELSYIAINVNATPSAGGRAAGDFDGGTAAENKVNDAYFFFFDTNGNPFAVIGYAPTGTEGSNNWIKYSYNEANGEDGTDANVERKLNSVLTLQKLNTSFPAYVVAVLNWNNTLTTSVTLDNLRKLLLDSHVNANNFVMSNSVYAVGNTAVYATSLNESNFATIAVKAQEAPVDIYVERVAVKATLNLNKDEYRTGSTTEKTNYKEITKADATKGHLYKTGVQIDIDDDANTPAIDVYAEILAWDLNTTINQSYLVKNLPAAAPSWTSWNDAANYRSYWAESAHVETNSSFTKSFVWNEVRNAIETSDYCLENTSPNPADKTEPDNRTKVLVKAQLVDGNGVAQNVAQWYGKYYATNNLAKVVAASLKNKLYTAANTPITSTDIILIPGYEKNKGTATASANAHDYYKVYFGLKDGVTVYGSAEATVALNSTEISAIFDNLSPAKVWSNGATYYYTNIAHLPESGANAVIRNHSYVVTIEGVNGLGTPVYDDGDNTTPDPTIPDPVTPEETETYLAASINVLAWKMVNNNVVLGQ